MYHWTMCSSYQMTFLANFLFSFPSQSGTETPNVEWWDSVILKTESYTDLYRDGPQTSSGKGMSDRLTGITHLVEHPIQMRPPGKYHDHQPECFAVYLDIWLLKESHHCLETMISLPRNITHLPLAGTSQISTVMVCWKVWENLSKGSTLMYKGKVILWQKSNVLVYILNDSWILSLSACSMTRKLPFLKIWQVNVMGGTVAQRLVRFIVWISCT